MGRWVLVGAIRLWGGGWGEGTRGGCLSSPESLACELGRGRTWSGCKVKGTVDEKRCPCGQRLHGGCQIWGVQVAPENYHLSLAPSSQLLPRPPGWGG